MGEALSTALTTQQTSQSLGCQEKLRVKRCTTLQLSSCLVSWQHATLKEIRGVVLTSFILGTFLTSGTRLMATCAPWTPTPWSSTSSSTTDRGRTLSSTPDYLEISPGNLEILLSSLSHLTTLPEVIWDLIRILSTTAPANNPELSRKTSPSSAMDSPTSLKMITIRAKLLSRSRGIIQSVT